MELGLAPVWEKLLASMGAQFTCSTMRSSWGGARVSKPASESCHLGTAVLQQAGDKEPVVVSCVVFGGVSLQYLREGEVPEVNSGSFFPG